MGTFNKGPPLDLAYRKACIADAQQHGLKPVSTLLQLDCITYVAWIVNRQDKT